MPATNAVLHDKRYSADGIFCEPPKKLETAAAAAPAQNSQSQWNTNDYHWEERDETDFARQAVSDRLLNDRTIWSDANGNKRRAISSVFFMFYKFSVKNYSDGSNRQNEKKRESDKPFLQRASPFRVTYT